MRKLFLFLLLCLVTVAANAATPTAKPAKLSPADKADVERIEKYLNELKSVSANFLQVNDGGEFRHGTIAIQRPGKMRVNYDPPQKDLIIASDGIVHIWDAEMGQQTNLPVDSSIAEFILRDPLKFSGDVTMTHFARYPAKLELTLVATKDPAEGELTLIFEDKPLQLRQWRVLDAQSRTTGINLENTHEGVSFPPNTFDFIPPNLGKSPKSNAK
jgi:outer membrane lipoprotein-sorting protein